MKHNCKPTQTYFLGVILLVASVASGQTTRPVYVDDDQPTNGDGTSWTTAYRGMVEYNKADGRRA